MRVQFSWIVGLSVLMVGCAAAVGAAQPSAPAPAATSAFASAAQAPTPAPGGLTRGGALPVVPVGGGACIIGLNCGCIRGITCPGTVHHPPAPANAHPPDAPAGPGPGPGGG